MKTSIDHSSQRHMRRVHQLSVLGCAITWFVAGVLLGDVLARADTGSSPSTGSKISLAIFAVIGTLELIALWRGLWGSPQSDHPAAS